MPEAHRDGGERNQPTGLQIGARHDPLAKGDAQTQSCRGDRQAGQADAPPVRRVGRATAAGCREPVRPGRVRGIVRPPIGVDELALVQIRQTGIAIAVPVPEFRCTDRQDIVMDETNKFQPGIVIVAIADAQIDVLAHQVDRIVLDPNVDRHLRKGIEKYRQPRRQPQFGQREWHTDDQTRPHPALQHALAYGGDVSQSFRCLRIDGVAGVGERDAIAATHKQLLAEPALEVADLLADRRRRYAEFRGGQSEAAGTRRNLESLDRIQRRQPFHIESVSFS
ncbi:hypothetical protein X734_01175 [Mesorhizobium sp. L2C084A000]|nr:hypothetical protein X734_01175 [Mesorhizobium sp. L2C084A000]